MNHENHRNVGDERHGREILGRIVGKVPIDRDVGRQRRAPGHHQRIAVGRGARSRGGPGDKARARPVLDDDRLTQALSQPPREDPADDVVRAARGGHRDQRDRPRRILLRLRWLHFLDDNESEDQRQ
jgi:hypothetical protein